MDDDFEVLITHQDYEKLKKLQQSQLEELKLMVRENIKLKNDIVRAIDDKKTLTMTVRQKQQDIKYLTKQILIFTAKLLAYDQQLLELKCQNSKASKQLAEQLISSFKQNDKTKLIIQTNITKMEELISSKKLVQKNNNDLTQKLVNEQIKYKKVISILEEQCKILQKQNQLILSDLKEAQISKKVTQQKLSVQSQSIKTILQEKKQLLLLIQNKNSQLQSLKQNIKTAQLKYSSQVVEVQKNQNIQMNQILKQLAVQNKKMQEQICNFANDSELISSKLKDTQNTLKEKEKEIQLLHCDFNCKEKRLQDEILLSQDEKISLRNKIQTLQNVIVQNNNKILSFTQKQIALMKEKGQLKQQLEKMKKLESQYERIILQLKQELKTKGNILNANAFEQDDLLSIIKQYTIALFKKLHLNLSQIELDERQLNSLIKSEMINIVRIIHDVFGIQMSDDDDNNYKPKSQKK